MARPAAGFRAPETPPGNAVGTPDGVDGRPGRGGERRRGWSRTFELLKHYRDRLSPVDGVQSCRARRARWMPVARPRRKGHGVILSELLTRHAGPGIGDASVWTRDEGRGESYHSLAFFLSHPFSFSYVGADADAANAQRRRSHPVRGNLRPVQIHCHEVGEDEGGNLVTDLSRRDGKG